MNIGVDFDGVLAHIDIGFLRHLMETGWDKNKRAWLMQVWNTRHKLFDPTVIALPDDKIYVISNCFSEEQKKEKSVWLEHNYGNRLIFRPTSSAVGSWDKDYVDPVARAKLDKCYELKIDVYFDDDPAIIRVMRELHKKDITEMPYDSIPFIYFMKYGPGIMEFY